MNKPIRKACLLGVAIILAGVLISVVRLPKPVSAGCGSDVSWQIWNETDSRDVHSVHNRWTRDTSDWSSRSTQHSNNGQDSTHAETVHVNPDGSSQSSGDFDYTDSEGKGCYSGGVPFKGHSTRDEEWDSKGNRKDHYVDIVEKNGKCIKYVRDREWDSHGKLIKQTDTETEVPCSKYNLQVSFTGSISNANMTTVYGPNTMVVFLEDKGKTYEGKYSSVLDGKVTGFCDGFIVWPFSIEVTAIKDEDFGDLVFSVKTTMREPWTLGECQGLSGNMKAGAIIVPPRSFRLATEIGSSATFTEGPVTWTYTLIKR
jgi:hypothetical protein